MKTHTDPLLRKLLAFLAMPDLTDEAKIDLTRRTVAAVLELRKAERMRRACQRTVREFGIGLADRESVEKQA